MTGKEESGIEPSYRVVCSISPEKNRSRRWMWRYVLWLSQASFSASWLVATTAWEEDLEPEVEEVR